MKTPIWCLEHIAELGQAVMDDQLTASEASEDLAEKIFKKDRPLASAILADWSRRKLRSWVYDKMRDNFSVEDDRSNGQDMLPFPDLPPKLEVAPDRYVGQRSMTGHDWDMALHIWENRRDQAQISYDRFKRRYDQIRPLLDEEDLTTGDVVDKLA